VAMASPRDGLGRALRATSEEAATDTPVTAVVATLVEAGIDSRAEPASLAKVWCQLEQTHLVAEAATSWANAIRDAVATKCERD
jgi:hypothetical protein